MVSQLSELVYYKYQATGNDFILIDNRPQYFSGNENALIHKLCHRHFGIGADGLILIETSADTCFRMRYFNADGKEGSMCGNGGRAAVAFAKYLGLFEQEVVFEAIDGKHYAHIQGDDKVALEMITPHNFQVLGEQSYFVNTGSPHYVEVIANLDDIDINQIAPGIRHRTDLDPGGVNVNFVSIRENDIFFRTYERGVEAETLSCGTGAVAVAYMLNHTKRVHLSELTLKVRGGVLTVRFSDKVELIGPAKFVFQANLLADFFSNFELF